MSCTKHNLSIGQAGGPSNRASSHPHGNKTFRSCPLTLKKEIAIENAYEIRQNTKTTESTTPLWAGRVVSSHGRTSMRYPAPAEPQSCSYMYQQGLHGTDGRYLIGRIQRDDESACEKMIAKLKEEYRDLRNKYRLEESRSHRFEPSDSYSRCDCA
jgi:hypothetical protein